MECLREEINSFAEVQQYIAYVIGKMEIQSSLVFDKHSGDLFVFFDLGNPMVNFAYVEEESVATHALAFVVRLCTNLKHIIAYYFTKDLTSFQLKPLF